jgi:hypothetical protein
MGRHLLEAAGVSQKASDRLSRKSVYDQVGRKGSIYIRTHRPHRARTLLVTELVKRGLVTIEYCPTADMVADLFTKPVQGPTFNRLRDKVMGNTPCIESKA